MTATRPSFFATASRADRHIGNIPRCGRCGLHKKCLSPRMPYSGKGRQQILLVGEAPGADEDKDNEAFVGKAGVRLEQELAVQGIDMNEDCWKTNAIRCRPPKNEATKMMMLNCRPALFAEIKKLKPKHIILLGGTAAESVMGQLFQDGSQFKLTRWLDWMVPHQDLNSWISIHYHPSYLEREGSELLSNIFRRSITDALRHRERPWKDKPNYNRFIQPVFSIQRAVRMLEAINTGIIAFDYETTCIKPEYEGAEIVTCAIAWKGGRTIAYPWTRETAAATSAILTNPRVKKVAANMKFEERWTRAVLGHRVNGWLFDTMVASHVLNYNAGVTSLSFQVFVRFGLPQYDGEVKPYLRSKGRSSPLNSIHKLDLKTLLLYNGMDAFWERKLAMIQQQEIVNYE